MKKFIISLLVFVMVISLCACGATETYTQEDANVSTEVEETSQTVKVASTDSAQESAEKSTMFADLNVGDEVSIIGQKANGTLVNDNTVWVQVVNEGERTVIYHCQLKDEFLEQGENLKMLDVVKVKGCFLNYSDMVGLTETLTEENTAIIVTLYDCEIL